MAVTNTEAQALADLQSATADIGTAIAAEITALQNAINAQGVNNSPAIEASVTKMRDLIGALNNSLAPPPPPSAGPVVASISPDNGPIAGGTSVTVTGTGFLGAPGATATVGGLAVPVTVVNDTTATLTTPASVAGPAAVVITNANGSSGSTVMFTFS